jgi:hypothetical protein
MVGDGVGDEWEGCSAAGEHASKSAGSAARAQSARGKAMGLDLSRS